MVYSILAGTVYVALVLTPCVIAKYWIVEEEDSTQESNVLDDGFI